MDALTTPEMVDVARDLTGDDVGESLEEDDSDSDGDDSDETDGGDGSDSEDDEAADETG